MQPGLPPPPPPPPRAPGGVVVVVVASSRASLEAAPEERRVCGEEENKKEQSGGEGNGGESHRSRCLFIYLLSITAWMCVGTNLWCCRAAGSAADWTGTTGAKEGKGEHPLHQPAAGQAGGQAGRRAGGQATRWWCPGSNNKPRDAARVCVAVQFVEWLSDLWPNRLQPGSRRVHKAWSRRSSPPQAAPLLSAFHLCPFLFSSSHFYSFSVPASSSLRAIYLQSTGRPFFISCWSTSLPPLPAGLSLIILPIFDIINIYIFFTTILRYCNFIMLHCLSPNGGHGQTATIAAIRPILHCFWAQLNIITSPHYSSPPCVC